MLAVALWFGSEVVHIYQGHGREWERTAIGYRGGRARPADPWDGVATPRGNTLAARPGVITARLPLANGLITAQQAHAGQLLAP